MSEAQRDGIGRRRSRAEIRELAGQYEASGLNRSEFCRRHGLVLSTLNRHLKRRQEVGEAPAGGEWIAVEVCASRRSGANDADSGLSIALAGGRRIEVGRGFDSRTLIQLLGLLEKN
ncbi:MAG: hypothetical protein NTY38_07745 [Acidobacteria bacterium]|nr:hypothetical protein [Acidobacteriota bacterium]